MYLLWGLLWGIKFDYSSASIDVKESAAFDNIRPVASTDEPPNFNAKKENRYVYMIMGLKRKIKLGFIQLIKASTITLLLIQKSRDVANLDICTEVLLS